MADEQTVSAGPHVSVNKDGHAVINGKNVKVRTILELLLTYRSLDDVAAKLQIGVEYVESAIAFSMAAIK